MLTFKKVLKADISALDVAAWINESDIKDRIQIFTNIDLGFKKKEQLKNVFKRTIDELLNDDLRDSELLTLLSTFEKLSDQIKLKLKKS